MLPLEKGLSFYYEQQGSLKGREFLLRSEWHWHTKLGFSAGQGRAEMVMQSRVRFDIVTGSGI